MTNVNNFEEVWHNPNLPGIIKLSNDSISQRLRLQIYSFVDRSGENTLDSRTSQALQQSSLPPSPQEDFSEYVAHLQLHMALQARNLVPRLTATPDSREQLLHQTQANFEKFASRQMFF